MTDVGILVGTTTETLLVFCLIVDCLEFILFKIKMKEIITINKITRQIINNI